MAATHVALCKKALTHFINHYRQRILTADMHDEESTSWLDSSNVGDIESISSKHFNVYACEEVLSMIPGR